MRKLLLLLILAVTMNACYEDYITDFEYDGIYFARQINARTLVVGEGMDIEIGVTLSGVRDNSRDREVIFEIDESLLTPSRLTEMKNQGNYMSAAMAGVKSLSLIPADFYTLSDNSKMVIAAGSHSGVVKLTANPETFLAADSTFIPKYAIPLRIVEADADSVLTGMDYTVVALKYENMLFGNYYHGGVTYVKDASENIIDTITYQTSIPTPEILIWKLKTVGPYSLVANGFSDQVSANGEEMRLTLEEDGQIIIESMSGAGVQIEPDGESFYNEAKLLQDRKLFLNYKYERNGNWHHATDTLTFRNRIRDGVNEWMDENPENYK